MAEMKNMLGVSDTDGMYIGKVVDAYLDNKNGILTGVLCQLLGTPARFLFYPITDYDAKIEKSKIILNPESRPFWKTPNFFDHDRHFPELMNLRGVELYNQEKEFLGILDDLSINPISFTLEKVFTTGGEQITIEPGEYYIDHFEHRRHLMMQVREVSPTRRKSDGLFFKGVVLPIHQKITEEKREMKEVQTFHHKDKQNAIELELNHV